MNASLKRALLLWGIALAGVSLGLFALGRAQQAQERILAQTHEWSATQRERQHLQTAPTPIPLSMYLSSRRVAPTNVLNQNATFERASANDLLGALIAYEKQGTGLVSQFSLTAIQPGLLSGNATMPAQQQDAPAK